MPARGDDGVTLVELLVVVAVIAVLSVPPTLFFLGFLRNEETNGAAHQVAALLNEARQLAITGNASYRVEIDAPRSRLRFVKTSSSTPWRGPGTDGEGYVTLENRARITAVTASPVFNPLGTASGGTITVQAALGTGCRQVVVSSTGRIRQTTPAACP
jgi:prepilin-type N-terminal cleavage/methylation domain-containing protein